MFITTNGLTDSGVVGRFKPSCGTLAHTTQHPFLRIHQKRESCYCSSCCVCSFKTFWNNTWGGTCPYVNVKTLWFWHTHTHRVTWNTSGAKTHGRKGEAILVTATVCIISIIYLRSCTGKKNKREAFFHEDLFGKKNREHVFLGLIDHNQKGLLFGASESGSKFKKVKQNRKVTNHATTDPAKIWLSEFSFVKFGGEWIPLYLYFHTSFPFHVLVNHFYNFYRLHLLFYHCCSYCRDSESSPKISSI